MCIQYVLHAQHMEYNECMYSNIGLPSLSSSGAGTDASPNVEAVEDLRSRPPFFCRALKTARVTKMAKRTMAAAGTHPIITMTRILIPDPVPCPRPRVGSRSKCESRMNSGVR